MVWKGEAPSLSLPRFAGEGMADASAKVLIVEMQATARPLSREAGESWRGAFSAPAPYSTCVTSRTAPRSALVAIAA